MKKQLFILLTAAVFFSISGVAGAEEAAKEVSKNWRNKKHKRDGGAASVIWAKYSKELAEIRKLRKEDPEAFKAKSKAFREKVRKEIKAEREKFKKLVMEYRKTQDPKIRETISKYVSDTYDRKLSADRKRITMLKQRLEKAEKKLAENKAKKEERINKILKTILKDPKLNW